MRSGRGAVGPVGRRAFVWAYLGRLHDNELVDAGPAGAHAGAQPGGAERDARDQPLSQLRRVAAFPQGLHLVPSLGILRSKARV